MKLSRKMVEVDLTRRLLRRLGKFELRRSREYSAWSVYKHHTLLFRVSLQRPLTGCSHVIGLLEMLNIMGMHTKLNCPDWLIDIIDDIDLAELDFRLSVEGF